MRRTMTAASAFIVAEGSAKGSVSPSDGGKSTTDHGPRKRGGVYTAEKQRNVHTRGGRGVG